MRFAFCNSKAVALFGAPSADDLLGTPVMERFHPDYHDEILKRIRVLNEERKPVENLFEQAFIGLDGSLVWVETSGQHRSGLL